MQQTEFFQALSTSQDIAGVPGTKLFDSGQAGRTTGILALTHGNEWMGLKGIESLYRELVNITRGRVLVVLGNIEAAKGNKRFVDEDLNRVFHPTHLSGGSKEAERARALLPVFEHMDAALDLHSVISTQDAPTFTVLRGGITSQVEMAKALDVPHHVHYPSFANGRGSVADHFISQGKPSLVLEAGHEDTGDMLQLITNVRRYLNHMGVVDNVTIPEKTHNPIFSELAQTEQIQHLDSFVYHPTFIRKGFAPVAPGQIIASDQTREYRVNESGYVLFAKKPEDYRSKKVDPAEPFVYLTRPIQGR